MNIKLHKNDLPDDLDLGNLIAVDGEFMGLNIRRDPLCLIQISTGNSDAHIIQLDRNEYKAPNLVKILENEKIAKIFHYGRADLAYIKYYLKTETNNILDTKIASKLSRSYSDNHSLKTLIKEFVNVDISKLTSVVTGDTKYESDRSNKIIKMLEKLTDNIEEILNALEQSNGNFEHAKMNIVVKKLTGDHDIHAQKPEIVSKIINDWIEGNLFGIK